MIFKKRFFILGGSALIGTLAIGVGLGIGLSTKKNFAKIEEQELFENKNETETVQETLKNMHNLWNKGIFFPTSLLKHQEDIDYFLDNLPDDLWGQYEHNTNFIKMNVSIINLSHFYLKSQLAINPNFFENNYKKWDTFFEKLKAALIKKYPNYKSAISNKLHLLYNKYKIINEDLYDKYKFINNYFTKENNNSIQNWEVNYTEEDKKQAEEKLNPLRIIWNRFPSFRWDNLLTTQGQINYFLNNLPNNLEFPSEWLRSSSLENLVAFYLNSQLAVNPNFFANDYKKISEFFEKLELSLINKYPAYRIIISEYFNIFYIQIQRNSINKNNNSSQNLISTETNYNKEDKKEVEEKLNPLKGLWNLTGIFLTKNNLLTTQGQINYFLNNLPDNIDLSSENLFAFNLLGFYLKSQLTINPNFFNDDGEKKWNEFFKKLETALIKKYPSQENDIKNMFKHNSIY
ncbi:hypothetical protein [Mesomycoplasma bovoculi]|uniref:Transmembrane protein n=1 Tax=Mesomycoplasma bovoculi M165/69 TaxID=743966 RepID=W5UST3_9BACT|nr:hypothetical protein [Mesomycoplasma bovoculi]AHH45187.1 hypothetical protein MYB_00870 [Mesomycoplasma bovoculi M165/69]